MRNETKYAILDIEMTPDELEKEKRIIQWAVVWIDDGKISYKESSLIQPGCPIAPHITKLTSITDKDVAHAPKFHETYLKLKKLLEGRVIVGQNILFDLQVVSEAVKRIRRKKIQIAGWIDTVEWSRVLHPTLLSYKLVDLVRQFHIQLENAHLADADAEATAKLFLRLNQDWENLPLGVQKRLIPILKTLHSDYSGLTNPIEEKINVSESDWEIFEKGCILHKEDYARQFYMECMRPSVIQKQLYDTEWMRLIFPSYEVRAEQIDFFQQLVESWQEQKAKAFEVRPGMGKTFAYLIAGLSQLNEENQQLVITTATKHLQKQIYQEQIPLAEKFFQKKICAYVLKGAQNYLCVKKFMNQLITHDEIYDVRLAKAQILTWLQGTTTGDIDELNLTPNGEKFFSLCACRQGCLHVQNQANDICFYAHHMENARNCDVLIMNHSVFVQNLSKENAPLFKGCKMVVDEAHDLEKAMIQYGTKELDFQYVFFHFSQIGTWNGKKLLNQYMHILQKYGEYDSKNYLKFCDGLADMKRIFTSVQHEIGLYESCRSAWIKSLDEGRRMIQARIKQITSFKQRLQDMITERDQKVLFAFSHHISQIEQYMSLLQKYMQNNSSIHHMEAEKYTRPCVLVMMDHQRMQNILEHLKKYQKCMVFCSGTLMVYGRADFFLEGLDLKEQLDVAVIGTEKASESLTVYLPNHSSHQPITSEETIYDVQSSIQFLIQKGHQKILILCNSKEMVEALYPILSAQSACEAFEILAQGRTSRSKEKLYEMFKNIPQGILLGTHGFYEGVDFPEETCTAVILPTLPFFSPDHPYIKARQARLDCIESLVFMKILLPNALLLFRQALGRLKRGNHVKKDFILLDRRICTRTYKKLFLQTIETEKKAVIHFPLFLSKVQYEVVPFIKGSN